MSHQWSSHGGDGTLANEPLLRVFGAREESPPENRTEVELRAAQVYRGRLALLTALKVELYALSFAQIAETGSFDGGNMDEDVLRAILWLNEAESFGRVKPLYGAN